MYDRKLAKHATTLLDTLIALDKTTVKAYYEMGQILHSIRESNLATILGYDSFPHLVEEELSYSPGSAHRYCKMFTDFKRLHYNKKEALKLLEKFGMTHVADVMPDLKAKIGERAMKNRIENLPNHQINFMLSANDYDKCQKALIKLGAAPSINTGRLMHASHALMVMVNSINGKKATATNKVGTQTV